MTLRYRHEAYQTNDPRVKYHPHNCIQNTCDGDNAHSYQYQNLFLHQFLFFQIQRDQARDLNLRELKSQL